MTAAALRLPAPPARLWRAWFGWVTAGETLGFVAPATVGALTTRLAEAAALPCLLAAGAIEGALLGAAQAHVLRRVLPLLPGRRWIMATATGAVLAYLIAMVPSLVGGAWSDLPVPLLVAAAVVLGTALLLSIGTAQWTVLRGQLVGAGRWVAWTAAGWLVGLAVFMAIAPPLWHEGQSLATTIAIGLLAAVAMAAAAAAVTGLGLIRLTRPSPAGRA